MLTFDGLGLSNDGCCNSLFTLIAIPVIECRAQRGGCRRLRAGTCSPASCKPVAVCILRYDTHFRQYPYSNNDQREDKPKGEQSNEELGNSPACVASVKIVDTQQAQEEAEQDISNPALGFWTRIRFPGGYAAVDTDRGIIGNLLPTLLTIHKFGTLFFH